MAEKKKGRPPGITKYDTAGKHGTHWMTAAAHAWVKLNREWIERKAKRELKKRLRTEGQNNDHADQGNTNLL